jgi:methyltransferase (TIGR00027 family)
MSGNKNTDQLLGMTAHWTAAVRARESKREDCLFNDPWAALLAGEAGTTWIESRSDDSVLPIVLRTRFFDDFLQKISTQFAVNQFVLVAAGLDTRAFRLSWPKQTQLFELDQPSVLEYKEQILHSAGAHTNCSRTTVSVDLSKPWFKKLEKAGFNHELPSCWLLEGFLFYLPNDQLDHILDDIAHLAVPGSWMGFDVINPIMLSSPITR